MSLFRGESKDESEVKLGERYRDKISGFEGVAIAKVEFIYGCTRVTLQALKDGDIKEFTFDAPSLIELATNTELKTSRTGGTRDAPQVRSVPSR